jgi:hypothetical protein
MNNLFDLLTTRTVFASDMRVSMVDELNSIGMTYKTMSGLTDMELIELHTKHFPIPFDVATT